MKDHFIPHEGFTMRVLYIEDYFKPGFLRYPLDAQLFIRPRATMAITRIMGISRRDGELYADTLDYQWIEVNSHDYLYVEWMIDETK